MNILIHFLNKLELILSTIGGWLSLLGIIIVNYFSGYSLSISLVILLVVLDLVWGVAASIVRGTFAKSELARDTFSKFTVYGSCIIVAIALDKLIGIKTPISTVSICSLIMLVEAFSMAGSMLIVNPKMPFLRLLQPILIGEIANKLHMSVEEAKKYLTGKEL